jgi:hypothetical protein
MAAFGETLKRGLIRRLAPLVLSLLFLGALLATTVADAQTQLRQRDGRTPTAHSNVVVMPAVPSTAPGSVVRVGLHVRNIYSLSLVDQSFLAEGWYWLEWGDDVQEILDRGKLNPESIVELANEIEQGQYSIREVVPVSEELATPESHHLTVNFSGKFYVSDVPQRFAPFDTQILTIVLQVKAERLASGPRRLRLEPLHSAEDIAGEEVGISGYELDDVSWRRDQLVYRFEAPPNGRCSRLSAVFAYGKSEWAMFIKWVFPVLVVMTIVIVSPSIEGVLGDIRLAIPPLGPADPCGDAGFL